MGSGLIGRLAVAVVGDINELKKNFGTAKQEIGGLKKEVDKTGISFQTTSKVMAAAGVAIVTTLTAMVVKTAQYADQIDEMSEKTGVARETLQGFSFVAKQNGIEIEGLSKVLGRLSKEAFSAAYGGKESASMFAKLGVNVRGADGHLRKIDDIFLDLADRFSKMPNDAERVAVALNVFGKSGAEILPMLMKGSQGIRDMMEEARRLGIILDEKSIKEFADLQDKLDQTQMAFGGLTRQMATLALPTVIKLTNATIDFVKWLNQLPPSVKGFIANSVGITAVVGIMSALLIVVQKVITAMRTLTSLKVAKFMTDYASAVREAAAGSAEAAAKVTAMRGSFLQAASAAAAYTAVLYSLNMAFQGFGKLKSILMKPEDISNLKDLGKAMKVQADIREEINRLETILEKDSKKKQFKMSAQDREMYQGRINQLKKRETVATGVVEKLQTAGAPQISNDCYLCGKKFKTPAELSKHLETAHDFSGSGGTDEKADFEKDWRMKALQESGNQRTVLEAEEKEALAQAKKLGASTVDVKKYYAAKRLEIDKDEARQAGEAAQKAMQEARERVEEMNRLQTEAFDQKREQAEQEERLGRVSLLQRLESLKTARKEAESLRDNEDRKRRIAELDVDIYETEKQLMDQEAQARQAANDLKKTDLDMEADRLSYARSRARSLPEEIALIHQMNDIQRQKIMLDIQEAEAQIAKAKATLGAVEAAEKEKELQQEINQLKQELAGVDQQEQMDVQAVYDNLYDNTRDSMADAIQSALNGGSVIDSIKSFAEYLRNIVTQRLAQGMADAIMQSSFGQQLQGMINGMFGAQPTAQANATGGASAAGGVMSALGSMFGGGGVNLGGGKGFGTMPSGVAGGMAPAGGGGAAGALGGMMPMLSMMGPWGMAIGAIASLAGGMFGDNGPVTMSIKANAANIDADFASMNAKEVTLPASYFGRNVPTNNATAGVTNIINVRGSVIAERDLKAIARGEAKAVYKEESRDKWKPVTTKG